MIEKVIKAEDLIGIPVDLFALIAFKNYDAKSYFENDKGERGYLHDNINMAFHFPLEECDTVKLVVNNKDKEIEKRVLDSILYMISVEKLRREKYGFNRQDKIVR